MVPNELRNNRILVIDDNVSIHEDIRKILGVRSEKNGTMANAKAMLFDEQSAASERIEFEIDSAAQGEEGLSKVRLKAAVGCPYAVAFVDVRMPPGWDGVETITRIWKEYPDLQIVLCTAYTDYSWDEMIEQLGRSDSLVILKKPFDNIEVLQLAYALTHKWVLNNRLKQQLTDLDKVVTQRTTELQSAHDKLKNEFADRMEIEKALRLSEERFSKAFRASPIPLAIQSLKPQIYVDANDGFQQITGYTRDELIGRTPVEMNLWEDTNEASEILLSIHSKVPIRNRRARLRTKTGEIRDTLLSVELFELDNEPFVLTNVQDITEQIKLEYELRQSQKMEAIGQLAAGVAHDFNNILTVVQGHACLLLGSKVPESPDYRSLETISAAAERASKLVRQLLTFSRKQFLQIRTMDIRETLESVSEMFPRVLGEHINVKVVTAPDLPLIDADAGMMEQILMNLAVNGRDAMPQGGTLTIQADTVVITPEAAYGHPESRPSKFLCLIVSDTGCGISPEVLLRVFEPFFTTKPVGQGTGLGLATVYGVTKRHKGWVEVQSQTGEGTTFKVFIPASEKVLEKDETKAIHDKRLNGDHGDETILVVEDEDALRELVVEVLKPQGYNVISASSGVAALEAWGQRTEKIHLLITDLVMPGGVMGRDLGEQLFAADPDLKVIYTSGYSPGLAGKDMALLEGKNFLAKPYPPIRLLRAVRDCLDCV